ncbi:hypothetical protein H1230_12650 [Paenibacillus sp. 19GGS1-52]|uniref:EbsA family protein n=1 Tax=Paenibacillus sp. 19GGS1-52 TaxID=2758563 RepID=UPI001EFB14AF|nr:EbsA family protein [Paenibacillus sp. 19GGS1-52]ULO09540.1 hypothetical protein H1230_12650 [Paenibacillus sp. 19GGS1-52]
MAMLMGIVKALLFPALLFLGYPFIKRKTEIKESDVAIEEIKLPKYFFLTKRAYIVLSIGIIASLALGWLSYISESFVLAILACSSFLLMILLLYFVYHSYFCITDNYVIYREFKIIRILYKDIKRVERENHKICIILKDNRKIELSIFFDESNLMMDLLKRKVQNN